MFIDGPVEYFMRATSATSAICFLSGGWPTAGVAPAAGATPPMLAAAAAMVVHALWKNGHVQDTEQYAT